MLRYAGLRLLNAVPTLLLVSAMVFALVRLAPGDPAALMLGDAATPEAVARLRADWGLDRPIPAQFWLWLRSALSGELGQSITNGEPVTRLVLSRALVSAPIVLLAVLFAALIATPLGLFAAARQNRGADAGVVAVSTLFLSIPSFWLGLMLLLVFGIELRWVPVVGYVSFATDPWRAASFIALPVVTLTLVEFGLLTRMMRASAVEVMRLDYVTHARAKGLAEGTVFRRHVLPNAFGPTWTLIGLVLGNLLGGVAVVETVFTIPGLGRLLIDAIFQRDYPVVQGCLLFTAAIYVLVNLVFDLVLPLFDPQVRR
jgi:peptide/nickel transport system permease protein